LKELFDWSKKMEKIEYPQLFLESDQTAVDREKKYYQLIRLKITVLLFVGLITSINIPADPSIRTPTAIILATVMVLSIALTAYTSTRNVDKIWLFSRKMAEEIKSKTWKFMMKADEFDGSLSNSDAEKKFLDELREILHRNSIVCSELPLQSTDSTQITEFMQETRRKPLKERINIYLKNRLHDQRCWYAEKAKWNKTRENGWFTVTWILELTAVILAAINIAMINPIISPLGVALTAAGGIVTWINSRSYREPAESYSIISNELSIIESGKNSIINEKDLENLVNDVEQLIKQEHSIWLSRVI
jgi:hypothetical protein